ncbi:RNA-binding protein 33-like isoform X2 [Phymastichus coffea]|uniref:RNA-binding protein 33-like isoform X2 n=1 Tax=Phymastichus coffea TaxID=108790 RepID=UPI00273BE5F2|nr:RNA-binding protein 33-like isoform X2 [Phymastichus coffea]
MSDHDDILLDEDLGDEEYDLGNDEEEALLADDNDFERLPVQQTVSKGEEETDDVLDLGVTDALDDLEAEEENVQSRNNKDKAQPRDAANAKKLPEIVSKHTPSREPVSSQESQERHSEEEPDAPLVRQQQVDLREKLREKSNSQREAFARNGQSTEDDECEEGKERRNRFQSERSTIPKMNHNIPDSLENVVTAEQHRPHYRSRDRVGDRGDRPDRSDRGGDRGDRGDRRNLRGRSSGRYDILPSGRFLHVHNPLPANQQPPFRGPLLENRPPFPPGPPSNLSGQPPHHPMYPHPNTPAQPPYHHPLANSPLPGHPHFGDPRLPILPNQFPDGIRPQGPRLNMPRIDYGPRCPPPPPPGALSLPGPPGLHPSGPPGIPGHPPGPPGIPPGPPGVSGPPVPGPAYNCQPSQPPFGSNQGMFPNHQIHLPERAPAHLGGSQGPPMAMMQGPSGPHIPGNQPPIIPSSQDQQFENHPPYDNRNSYNPAVSQFNHNASQIGLPVPPSTSQQQQMIVGITNVPNVPSIPNVPAIPTGHKILINPHFRGNPIKSDGKAPQDPADKFVQALKNASNARENRSNSAKPDDPFSYFSDMWQESKSHKPASANPRRSYSPETNYKSATYDSKYKSDSQWSHRDNHTEEHRSSRDKYRERDLSPRPRNDQKHFTTSPDVGHRGESHNHSSLKSSAHKEKSKSVISPSKEASRLAQKRALDEMLERNLKEEESPKKLRLNSKHAEHIEKPFEKEEKEEEMDPEMREYRRKMEEQKRLRERILREKENRRKMAAMEKTNATSAESNSSENTKQESTIANIAKEGAKGKTNLTLAKGRSRLTNKQSTEENPAPARVVRTVQLKTAKEQLQQASDIEGEVDEDEEDDGGKSELLSRIILKKVKKAQKTATQKSSAVQKSSSNKTVTANRQLGQIRQLLTNSQRIVVQSSTGNPQKQEQLQRQRIVVNKGQEAKKLIKTNIVKVDNLAASTTEAQIRRMCQGIGSIESVQMGEGNATIVFKTQSAAMVFHKKYQRKMLDLSLIKVQLIPQTTTPTKASTVLLKNSAKN